MKLEKPEEKEMDLLLEEIPHATSAPHHPHHQYHHHSIPRLSPLHAMYGMYGHGHGHPNGMISEASSSRSSSSSGGTLSPVNDDQFRHSPELNRRRYSPTDAAADAAATARRMDELNLLNRFRALHVREDPEAGFGSNPIPDPFAFRTLRRSSSLLDPWPPLSLCNDTNFGRNSAISSPNGFGYDLNWNPPPTYLSGFLPKPQFGTSVLNERARTFRNIEAFNCEDSLIIQGKGLHYTGINGRDLPRERKRLNLEHSPLISPLKYDNLMEIEGYIFHIAKDQHGCRFLQRKFDEGKSHEIDVIFNGIIDHVVELMVNPFGNYLMQKLLDVCTEQQRMRIVLVLTQHPLDLVRISLNTHGTRAVQKLIETLKTPQQIGLVVSALKPGFLDLIKDLNGNHVVQRCLQSLSSEDNKFIFDAAAKHCVDIATHRHGCCVLQRCITHSTGEHRANLVAEIAANGLLLAQDAFGNYAVQFIIDLNNSSAAASLVSQFEGNYVHLSMQKFSSNVVEKCLNVFVDNNRARIVLELLSFSRFEQLLQDPYANYVIQSALTNTKGALHAALVDAIRPYAAALRTSPYCKKIFSRTLLKK